MNLTLLKGYNNYFDRIVKKELLYDEYLDKSENYYTIQNINFIPNDGINTEQVINWKENWTPDYLLITDEDENIVSRWFVLDAIRTRGKQFRLQLRRDVIVDNFEYIKDAPIYVEKGTLHSNSPLIYNDENMEFNQIKADELLLKDKSKCAWLVGYYTKKHETKTFKFQGHSLENVVKYEDLTDSEKYYYQRSKGYIVESRPGGQVVIHKIWHFPISKARHYELNFYYGINHIRADVDRALTLKFIFESEKYRKVVNSEDAVKSANPLNLCYDARTTYKYFDSSAEAKSLRDTYATDYFVKPFNNLILTYTTLPIGDTRQDIILKDNQFLDEIKLKSANSFDKELDSKEIELIHELSKKIILEPNGSYHQVHINTHNNLHEYCYVGDSLYNYIISKTGNGRNPDTEDNVRYAYINTFRDYIELENKEISQSDGSTYYTTFDNIEDSSSKMKNHGESDMPYDIFYLPYTDNLYLYDDIYKKYLKLKYNKNIALGMATSILSQSGGTGSSSTLCYDIQLLPYCPDKDYTFLNLDKTTDTDLYINQGISSAYFGPSINSNLIDFIKCHTGDPTTGSALDKVEGIIFWSPNSLSERDIFISDKPNWLNVSDDAINKKIQNSCDFIRLCSPNYSGLYDMNVAKNEGIEFFNVDMVLRPFNPYIHINPNFKGLYYKDYNDSRGLICGGDFSIGSTSDAWTQYALNNKNYQQMFDREISNIDKTHSIEKTKNIVSATSGAISGAISGAGMGFMVGGPIGAAIGGIAAGAAGVAGGVADTVLNEQQYKENRSFKTDMYNMSLQNIKAQPTSLAKVSTLTNNNKIWPFVEYYTCTDEEKNAFRNKIIYNGMTIMKIDTLNNYISEPNQTKFFKGQLIRCEKLHDDAHIKNSIYKELNEGVFL